MTDLWRIWRQAAHTEARALRLLPADTRHRPLDLDAAIDDHLYLEYRANQNERARNYRTKKQAS